MRHSFEYVADHHPSKVWERRLLTACVSLVILTPDTAHDDDAVQPNVVAAGHGKS